MSTETTTEGFDLGDRVKIEGENGYYWVIGRGRDGSYSLWGGDKNPNGYRFNRAIMGDRLSADSRTLQRKNHPDLSTLIKDDESE